MDARIKSGHDAERPARGCKSIDNHKKLG